jgi:hypothetical protein
MTLELPPEIAAGLAAQLARRRADLGAGARGVGWKLAYGIAEIEALIGDAPAIGHLTSATLLEPGGVYRGAGGDRELRVETELAVEVGEGRTIAGLAVALEVVDVGARSRRPRDGRRRRRAPARSRRRAARTGRPRPRGLLVPRPGRAGRRGRRGDRRAGRGAGDDRR